MARLFGFDYKSPYFYMVTLKRLKGLADFSKIGPNGLIENELTKAFAPIIRCFHLKWSCLDEISPFVIMPNHLHLLMKIKDTTPRKSLAVLVWQLERALATAYWQVTNGRGHSSQDPVGRAQGSAPASCVSPISAKGPALAGCVSSISAKGPAPAGCAPPIFEPDWHDWIVKKRGQLAAFRNYIRENPSRAWLRRKNAQFFGHVREVEFLGHRWFAYGNTAILDLPVITPFKCSRKLVKGSAEYLAFTALAERIGPGGAGIGTFMSPCEKECGNLIAKVGGKLIILSPEGFGPRWHPPRVKERFCAQGRMLFLSLYPADTKKPDNATLYRRCHEMGDIVNKALPSREA